MTWHPIRIPRAEKNTDCLHPKTARRMHRALGRFSPSGRVDIRRRLNVTPETWRIRICHHRVILDLREDRHEGISFASDLATPHTAEGGAGLRQSGGTQKGHAETRARRPIHAPSTSGRTQFESGERRSGTGSLVTRKGTPPNECVGVGDCRRRRNHGVRARCRVACRGGAPFPPAAAFCIARKQFTLNPAVG